MYHVILLKRAKCPLTLKHLVLYSNMAFKDRALTVQELATQSKLGEREVQLCVAELREWNLIVQDMGGWQAWQEPPIEWFVNRTATGAKWSKKIAFWIFFPSTNGRLTLEEAAVWSFIFTQNFKRTLIAPTWIAESIGLSVREAQAAFDSLTHMGLLEATRNGGRLAIYDEAFGQVLLDSSLDNASQRGVIRAAKPLAPKAKLKVEDVVKHHDVDDLREGEGHLRTPEMNFEEWELGLLDGGE
jgi:hypothetical protein